MGKETRHLNGNDSVVEIFIYGMVKELFNNLRGVFQNELFSGMPHFQFDETNIDKNEKKTKLVRHTKKK